MMRFLVLVLVSLSLMAGETSGPQTVAVAPGGDAWAVTDPVAGQVVLMAGSPSAVGVRVPVPGVPAGLAWAGDGRELYVAEQRTSSVLVMAPSTGQVLRRLSGVGRRPSGLAWTRGGHLLVCASGEDAVVEVDPVLGGERRRWSVAGQPQQVAVAGPWAVAVPLLPTGPATPASALSVAILDVQTGGVRSVALPAGSTAGRAVAVDPSGRLALVTHVVARANLPTIIADAGWISTNALTLIDVSSARRIATVLLDEPSRGAADPWGVTFAEGGDVAWVALAGVHALARVEVGRLLALIQGQASTQGLPSVWAEIRGDPTRIEALVDDLTALTGAGLMRRYPVPGLGPRGVAMTADGTVLTALAFSGVVARMRPEADPEVVRLGPPAAEDPVRWGEQVFHDASRAYQGWLSCATCHIDGRSDGLFWDRLNDGVGNPKNTRSLVGAAHRAPAMSLGVYPDAAAAVAAAFETVAFRVAPREDREAVLRFLAAQQPELSPWRMPEGGLSPAAERGRLVFEGPGGCIDCHSGPWRSDFKRHRLGTTRGLDAGKALTTPILVELWRTAPYLHDGSAATLEAVFEERNPDGRHGEFHRLAEEQRRELMEFLRSL